MILFSYFICLIGLQKIIKNKFKFFYYIYFFKIKLLIYNEKLKNF